MTKTNTYTNLTALIAVADLDEVKANEPLAAKIAAMIKAEQTKRDRAKSATRTESKEKRQNRALAVEIMRAIVDAGNEPRTTSWISDRVKFCDTSHKVTGKMNIARANGWVAYGDNVGGKRTFFVTDAGIAYLTNPTD